MWWRGRAPAVSGDDDRPCSCRMMPAGTGRRGRPRAGAAPTNARVSVVSQNLLHGIACPSASDRCDLDGRARCSCDNSTSTVAPHSSASKRRTSARSRSCGKTFRPRAAASTRSCGTTIPVSITKSSSRPCPCSDTRRIHLAGPLRTTLWYASRRTSASSTSSRTISPEQRQPSVRPRDLPAPCDVDETVNPCQGRQGLAQFVDSVAGDDSVVVVGGDFNATASEPAIAALTAARFTDTHLASGNPECDPATGAQCTSGGVDDDLTDLTNPASKQSERIDFLFIGGPRTCKAVAPPGCSTASQPPQLPTDSCSRPITRAWRPPSKCETSAAQRSAAPSATVATITSVDQRAVIGSRRPDNRRDHGRIPDAVQRRRLRRRAEARRARGRRSAAPVLPPGVPGAAIDRLRASTSASTASDRRRRSRQRDLHVAARRRRRPRSPTGRRDSRRRTLARDTRRTYCDVSTKARPRSRHRVSDPNRSPGDNRRISPGKKPHKRLGGGRRLSIAQGLV